MSKGDIQFADISIELDRLLPVADPSVDDPSVDDPAASAGGRAVKKAENAQLLSVPRDGPVRKDNSS